MAILTRPSQALLYAHARVEQSSQLVKELRFLLEGQAVG